jgi:hypothetical protein
MKTIKQIYQKYKQLIPLLFLTYLGITTIITTELMGESYHFSYSYEQYGAFISLIATSGSFFYLRPYYKYVLLIILFLGLFNILNFTINKYSINIGIGALKTPNIQPKILLTILFTYIINFSRLNQIIGKYLPKPDEKEVIELQSEQINKFKKVYAQYTEEQLNNVIIGTTYVPEAKKAAEELLIKIQTKSKI